MTSELALGDEGLCAGLTGADLTPGCGPHGADSLLGLGWRAGKASPGESLSRPQGVVGEALETRPLPPTIVPLMTQL